MPHVTVGLDKVLGFSRARHVRPNRRYVHRERRILETARQAQNTRTQKWVGGNSRAR